MRERKGQSVGCTELLDLPICPTHTHSLYVEGCV